ncbi:MAG TPA: MFS transporter [Candidatus Blautia stercoravium]|nr:MFS transporter [Candidatus Blautia stercoravium]
MLQKLKSHVLAQTFRELKGNPKWSICTEPLWFIPYSLFVPFQTLYMRKLGLTSLEIGTTLTVGFILQMFFALIGGVITDKMGRRKATVIFDTLGWTVPCLIWAFSQNFWWFLAAAAVNAAFQITNTSWNCLFIEDCPPKHITNAFTLIQMCGMLSVFFSPLAVVLVGKHDVVPVMRWLYFIAAISMLAKFLLLYHFGGETQIGKKRMEETKNLSYFSMMKGYGWVFLTMIKSGKMRLVVYFMALTNIIQIATTNFFSLYVTEKIHLSDELIAVFPVIRTIVMIAFVIGLQNLFQKLRMKVSLQIGFLMYIASHLLLLITPEKNLLLVMGYTILEAAAYAVIIPRKDALMAHYVDPKERSRIYALYNVLMIGISAPFGSLIGWMFDLNPALPFLFNMGIFVLCIFLTMASRDLSHLEESIN